MTHPDFQDWNNELDGKPPREIEPSWIDNWIWLMKRIWRKLTK